MCDSVNTTKTQVRIDPTTAAGLDLSPLDDVSAKLNSLKSLIMVAIDLFQANAYHAENLLHGALVVHQSADEAIVDFHNDLLSIRREVANG